MNVVSFQRNSSKEYRIIIISHEDLSDYMIPFICCLPHRDCCSDVGPIKLDLAALRADLVIIGIFRSYNSLPAAKINHDHRNLAIN